ncbi:hypothetical protein ACQ4PT_071820 [Festuca glaucescens]
MAAHTRRCSAPAKSPDALGENDTYYPLSQNYYYYGSRREDAVDGIIAMLHDKRRAEREKALRALASSLETCCTVGTFDYRCATVLERCRASLEASSAATEARLVYRAIGLLALTVGSSDACATEILQDALPGLAAKVARAPCSPDAETAVAAIDCLAAVTFACARLPNQAFMNAICGVISLGSTANSEVLIAAVSALALVRATSRYRASFPLRPLVELLDTHDIALRIAVGEALAVWAERDMTASPVYMQALEIKLASVAADPRRKGVDKKRHAKQKKLFGEIAAMIATRHSKGHEEKPAPKWSASCVLRASGWSRTVQLNFLKRYLGNGFCTHTFFNPLIEQEYWSNDDDDGNDSDSSQDGDSKSVTDSNDYVDTHSNHNNKDCDPESHCGVEDDFIMVDNEEDDDFVMV